MKLINCLFSLSNNSKASLPVQKKIIALRQKELLIFDKKYQETLQ